MGATRTLGVLLVLLSLGHVRAADFDPAVSSLTALTVDPPAVTLAGPDAHWTLLVSAQRTDGRVVDQSGIATYSSSAPNICRVGTDGIVHAVADGSAIVGVTVGSQSISVPVTVSGSSRPRTVDFENDIEPLLSRFACNTSGCHGKAEGQNGFKLSVFGFDPQADFDALTKEGRSRRVSLAVPRQSLLLTKPSGLAPHGGGVRFAPDSPQFATLLTWLEAGAPRSGGEVAKIVAIELAPRSRLLAMGAQQRLRVVARYSDGAHSDVTHLAKFHSNNDGLASVDAAGCVTAGNTPGQVAVMASFMGSVDVFEALIPRAEPVVFPELAANNFIDTLVYDKLRQMNIVPAEVCDDSEYLRRVYLDLIGTLPTADEARAFLADTQTGKRSSLVDQLLQRPEFADYWALKWADLLRVDRNALGFKGAQEYHGWLRACIAQGKPLDALARELITAAGPVAETPPAHLYRAVTKPGELASTLSQVFLGVRLACAECHHHPSDRWSQTDYYGMQAFFVPVTRKGSALGESVVASGIAETKHPRTGEKILAHALGQSNQDSQASSPDDHSNANGRTSGDARAELAQWMTAADNPWFARNLANRLWAHLCGRGLVEPVDDMRATNPPSNPELLDALAKELVDARFDMRALIKTIVASRVYQQSVRPNASNEIDTQNYSRAWFKRLDAEVLLDAVCQTTGVDEKFSGLPRGHRAIEIWDSKLPHYFLRLFGRPVHETACQCERNVEPSVSQVLHLLNSPQIDDKLRHPTGRVAKLTAQFTSNGELADELYLTFYSRFPSSRERTVAAEHLSAGSDRRRAAEDLAWSLLNSLEFVFNH